ncbi:MAG: hypothetical protein QM776_09160 [Rhodocyclaceae bacterium]
MLVMTGRKSIGEAWNHTPKEPKNLVKTVCCGDIRPFSGVRSVSSCKLQVLSFTHRHPVHMPISTALVRFRLSLSVFMVGLIISGLTAFPILTEVQALVSWLGLDGATSPAGYSGMTAWVLTVKFGLEDMYARYPWIAYGTDWLAFGHLTIALFFIGPLYRPAESRHVLLVGIAACVLVFPLALICGDIRGVPLMSRLIDCLFGVFGMIPLIYCLCLLKHISPCPPASSS